MVHYNNNNFAGANPTPDRVVSMVLRGTMGTNGFNVCVCQPWAEEGMALLEEAAGQGHAYAMDTLGSIHCAREEYEHATEWYTKAVEAGLPKAMAGGSIGMSTRLTFLSPLLLRILSGAV